MNSLDVLRRYRKIAVLGISPNPDRPSYYVSEHMLGRGYEVVGVNPAQTDVLGRPCYPSLAEVPGPLEIVAVFRASEHLAGIVKEAIALAPKVLWIQLGIEDAEAEREAERAGIVVVRRQCLMVEEERLSSLAK